LMKFEVFDSSIYHFNDFWVISLGSPSFSRAWPGI